MYSLISVLTAFQNVALPLLLTRRSKAARRRHVETALAVVGLSDRMHHYPHQLSGGQEQRVSIARAIVSDPTFLLCDEPTGDLDRKSADEILDLIDRLPHPRPGDRIALAHESSHQHPPFFWAKLEVGGTRLLEVVSHHCATAKRSRRQGMFLRTIIALGFWVFSTYTPLKVSVAQENGVGPDIEGPVQGSPVMPVEMNIDLRELPVVAPLSQDPIEVPLQETRRRPAARTSERRFLEENREGPAFSPKDRGGRRRKTPPEFSKPDPNFDGIQLGDPGAGFIPPDTNGDVGPNHYVQTVNSAIAIFDKEGNTLAGPVGDVPAPVELEN